MDIFWNKNEVRKVWYLKDWWYVVEDIVASFIDTNINGIVAEMRSKDIGFSSWYDENARYLTMSNGRSEYCVNLEGVFRLIQSINSVKANPFKLWLARLGKLRLDQLNES